MPAKNIHRKCDEVKQRVQRTLVAAGFTDATTQDAPRVKVSGFVVSDRIGAAVEVGYVFVGQEKITDAGEALGIQQDELEKYLAHLRQAFPGFKVRLEQVSPYSVMIVILL